MSTLAQYPEQRISIGRFIAAELVLTLGVASVLSFKEFWWMGYLLISISRHCFPSKRPEEWDRPLKWKDAIWIVGGLEAVAAVVALIFAVVRLVPDESMVRLLRHPVVLAALWLIATRLYYRRWAHANGPTAAPEPSPHPLP